MSQFLPLIRSRLLAIAEDAAAAALALEDAEAVERDARQLADVLQVLDCAGAKVAGACERLASALDPQRLACR
jgi:hypothetical protein